MFIYSPPQPRVIEVLPTEKKKTKQNMKDE